MAITVTPDQVDNARLLIALDKARGHTSAEWIVRLANAAPAPATPTGETGSETGGGDGCASGLVTGD